jgi:beta-glucosidase
LLQINGQKDCINFPKDFKFGVATSAYQIEGAYNESGKVLSNWDVFCSNKTIADGSNGNVANDHYHRYKDDVKLIKDLKVGYYRFSIAWARIINEKGEVNMEGVSHYKDEIKNLIDNGLQPVVTLYHWDIPDYLDKNGGWLNNATINAFVNYTRACFTHFGDQVKYWITFNEPWVFAWQGHGIGNHAPGRCSDKMGNNCIAGNSSTEPYIVAHHTLISHAKTVELYRNEFKKNQSGVIGITLNSDFALPLNESDAGDVEATARYLEFSLGWFAHPVIKGDYPDSMKTRIGDRLPPFSEADKILLKNSVDFLGINHYTTAYVINQAQEGVVGWAKDKGTNETKFKDGKPIGDVAQSTWLYVYPNGMRGLLNYISKTYGKDIDIWITENGVDAPKENEKKLDDVVKDDFRTSYLKGYISALSAAINDDKLTQVKAYFVWSLMDNFEWAEGYVSRFGIYHNDYNTQVRTMKNSAKFYRDKVVTCAVDPTPTDYTLYYYILGIVAASIVVIVVIIVVVIKCGGKKDYEHLNN